MRLPQSAAAWRAAPWTPCPPHAPPPSPGPAPAPALPRACSKATDTEKHPTTPQAGAESSSLRRQEAPPAAAHPLGAPTGPGGGGGGQAQETPVDPYLMEPHMREIAEAEKVRLGKKLQNP